MVTALRWVHQVVVPWAQRDKVCANVKDKTKTDKTIQMFIFIMYGADKCNKISTCYRVQYNFTLSKSKTFMFETCSEY